MPLKFQPKVGSVVMCDFEGYVVPEMIKVRPVVVLAKHPDNSQLVTVVPLSTTEPIPHKAYHHRIESNPLPGKTAVCWAKCDMVATVSLARLDRFKTKQREWVVPTLGSSDFDEIKKCVKSALGLI
jgi:uncharacterized protein YifN (PemK superfamily)